jgi:Exportin-5 family
MQVLMLLVDVATSAPGVWASRSVCQAATDSLGHALDMQELRSLRLCIHHGTLPLTRACPPEHAAQWLPALLEPLIVLLGARLGEMWSEMVARLRGEAGAARAQQTEDEIIAEVQPAPN